MSGIGYIILLAGFIMAAAALQKISALNAKLEALQQRVRELASELLQLRPPAERKVEETKQPWPFEEKKPDVPEVVPKRFQEPEEVKVTAPVLPQGNWNRASKSVKVMAAGKAAPKTVSPIVAVPEIALAKEESAAKPFTAPPPVPPVPPKSPQQKRDMEQALASRWFVWIGGIALAIGGLLFVKYAYDNGYISPTLQIILALVLAAVLIFMGDRALRSTKPGGEPDYVPAALSAGGLVTAFASIYAAYALYELVPPLAAFVGLALVGIGALALSLRQGPMIAALGLVGSYATPTIISSPNPSAWGFFPYLLIIMVASFAVLRKRPWMWLGFATVAGSAIWALLWLSGAYTAGDIMPVGLFALSFGTIAVLGISARAILNNDAGSLLHPQLMNDQLQVGAVGIVAASFVLAALVFKSSHDGLVLTLFFVAMAAACALSWFKRGDTEAVAAAALLSFIVLMGWREAAFHEWAMDENGLWSTVLLGKAPQYLRWMLFASIAFTAFGILGYLKKTPALVWSVTAAGAAVLFTTGAWARVDALRPDHLWALLAVAFAIVLLAAVWKRQAAEDDSAPGTLCLGAALLMLFAADRWFDAVWLSLAIAVLALVYAGLTKLLNVCWLGPISAAFGTLTTLRLFAARELWTDDRTLPLGEHWPLYGYGVPIILFIIASRWLKAAKHDKWAVSLEAVSLGLAISLVSLEVRVLIGGGVTAPHPQLLEMSTHILTWLGAAYGLFYRQRVYSSFVANWGACILLGVSIVAIVAGPLLALNPLFGTDPLEGGRIFNALLMAYLAPAGLLLLIARRMGQINLEKWRPHVETFAAFLFTTFVSLEIKRLYAGPTLFVEPRDEIESALHILAWLGLAAGMVYRGNFLSPLAALWSGRALLAFSLFGIVAGSLLAYNPTLTYEPIHGNAVFNSLLLTYLVPAGLLWFIARKLEPLNLINFKPYLEIAAVALFTVFVSFEFKRLYNGPIISGYPSDEVESAIHILVWFVLALGVLASQNMFTSFAKLWSSRGLVAMSVLAIVLTSLFAFNPVVSGMPLHGNVIFNSLLLSYIAPIGFMALVARRIDELNWRSLLPAFGGLTLVLALTYVTLETKRIFQGPVMVPHSLSTAESYAYSAVWLASAFALFVTGIKLAKQYIRYAGLGVMVLVVLKVFLWDMSGLDGIYRILSFMGLGLCLIGMGWIYTKFVQKPPSEQI